MVICTQGINYQNGCPQNKPEWYIADMPNNIHHYRRKLGYTQDRLAELCNTSTPQIQRLEKGERKLTLEWAERLAGPLGVRPANLLFDPKELSLAKQVSENEIVLIERAFEPIPVVGKVEAGLYSHTTEWPESEWVYYSLPVSLKYPNVKRYCLEVRGNSMNLEFAPGSLVVCIDLSELNEAPQDGEVYVVDHTAYGKVESSLKELRIMPDGEKYLWPRSDDPAHQQPIKLSEDEPQLRAKVVGDYQER